MKFAGAIEGPQAEDTILHRGPDDGTVTIDDPALLFSAEFSREGPDLVLENPGAPNIRIVDYFAHAVPADLTTPGGATLRGPVVDRLAGPETPGQYAQAGAPQQGVPIGQVETLEGVARVQRADGTLVDLGIGAKVYQNDVVITENDGKVSITFVDGTMFTLASGSRMVLDELIYAPDSENNSATFSLVEGSFVFIAGQVAKTGDMDVTTPSATMGIRGTTVLVDVQTIEGVTTVAVSLNTDPDGGLGEIVVSDLAGNEITTITQTDTKWVVPVGDEPYEVERTADELASDSEILDDAVTAYANAMERLEAGQSFVDFDSSSRSGTSYGDPGSGGVEGAADDGEGGDGNDTDETDGDDNAPPPDFGPDPTELDSNEDATLAPDTTNAGIEDSIIPGSIPAGDLDGEGEGEEVTFAAAEGANLPPAGLIFASDGSYTLDATDPAYQDLAVGEQRTVTFGYTATSGGSTDAGTLSLTVTGTNDAPTLAPGSMAVVEDGPVITLDLAAFGADIDSDDDGGTLSYAVTAAPAKGSASFTGTTLSFDPGDDFQDLAEGETRDVTIGVTATDAHGDSAANTVTVTVTGTNDAPVAEDLLVSGGKDGGITGTVVGADPDAGNSLQFGLGAQGPVNGQVTVNPDGSFTYKPAEGFAGFDSFEVTASDGSLSDTATVTVAVSEPGSQEAQDRGLGISIDSESVDGRPAGSVNVTRSTVEATPINLVFALDGSSSFANEFNDQIQAVKDTLAALAGDFDGPNAPQVNVEIIVFSSDATSYGKNGVDTPADGFTPFDLVADAAAIQTTLDGIPFPGRGTDWKNAINEAKAFFDQENTAGNDAVDFLYFITDGQPTGSDFLWQNAVKNIRDAHDPQIFTFGIGSGFDGTQLEQTFTIDGVDYRFDSNGDARTISSATDLTAEIQKTGLFAAELVSFSLELESDGIDHGVIATEIDNDSAGFTLPLASVAGIEDMLGENNDFVATAVFDLDGDTGTTSDQLTIIEAGRLSAPEGPVALAGSTGADLLLGGSADDSLGGSDGDDLLIGGGGNDSVLGGAGDDLLVLGASAGTVLADGGTGRDTLKFDMAGDLTSDALPTLAITDIEALDMTNARGNELSLTLADIEGLSSERDTDLEALLGGALSDPDSASVYGDPGDSLQLTNPDGTIKETPTGPVTDSNGTTLDIYQFFDGSNTLLATLAVDEDVSVVVA